MPKINILDKHVAELIAAGEVVERPSSVIKELVENSIDSGATIITVEIKNGGTTFMRVTDNGCGISRDDVPKAFLRHATSKVRDQDDLEKIMTLGFRGEALASISAVAKVEILTCTQDEIEGTRYIIHGCDEQLCEPTGCPVGTTIIVRDLFYNTPARMKFLKKDVAEANAVAGVIDRIALSHPEISFKFIRDGKECLNTVGNGELKSAVYSVYGRDFINSLIPISYELNGIKVNGFISKPTSARANRSMQHVFINGRYVKSRTAMVAMEEAYKGSIMVGKFPACVMHIALSCSTVDVNVHPAKIEVRFINEKPIFDAVYHGVKSALLVGDKRVQMSLGSNSVVEDEPAQKANATEPSIKQSSVVLSSDESKVIRNEHKPNSAVLDELEARQETIIKRDLEAKIDDEDEVSPEVFVPRNTVYDRAADRQIKNKVSYLIESIQQSTSDKCPKLNDFAIEKYQKYDYNEDQGDIKQQMVLDEESERTIFEEGLKRVDNKFIGEVFDTYIIVEHGKDELMLIDKHAAHERLIYEKLRKASSKSSAQFLLDPIIVTLDKNEYASIIENMDRLCETGFEVEDFGIGTVIVRAAPLYLEGDDIKQSIMEIAGHLMSNKSNINTEHMDWIYHNVACRAAIKAGQKTQPKELIKMIQELEENNDVRYCPHGRPISIIIKKREIEKQFGRV